MNLSWLNDPRMQKLPTDKRIFITNWFSSHKNQEQADLLPAILQFDVLLKKRGLSFNSEERNLLITIFTDSLSEKERQQFAMLKKLLQNKA